MIIIKRILPIFIAAVAAFNINNVAVAAPAEQTTQVVTRTANTNQAVARLSKNLYRQEQVQVPYTVQVPYQVTETYEVQVPYTVEVPYTDYVTDYRTEYRCHDVTRYRNERRCENVTDYRRECRNEQKCYLIPGEPGQCRDVTECGTNSQGQQICKTRRVCDGAGQPQQRCETQQICNNVPYTRQECRDHQVAYTDRECRNEQVAYQKEVTRYRNETRYRTETRTREVTKYREETKCCKTETQTVFDRQLQFQVVVSFPQDAVLSGSESESLKVTLTSAQPGQVAVTIVNSVYGYKVISQSQSGEVINVQLGLTPLFDSSNAATSSLKGLQVVYAPLSDKFVVSFTDSISHSKVQTVSEIEVRDLTTDALIEQGPATTLANGKTGLVVQTQLPSTTKVRAIVKTTRAGVVVAQGQLSFTSTAIYDRRVLTSEDIEILSDSSKVQLIAPNQQGVNASIKLTDSTEQFAEVSTKYVLSLFEIKNGKARAINTPQTVTREQAQAANGEVTIATLLGSKASSILKTGTLIRAQIEVKRKVSASGLNDPRSFSVTTDLVIQ